MSSEHHSVSSSAQQDLLVETRELTRRVRHEQRGGWFPLLVFAIVTLAAIPFDHYGHHLVTHCTSLHHGGYVCTGYSQATLWYWPVALLLAYVAISAFYLHQSRKRGIGTRVQPYVVVGVVLVLLVTAWALWAQAHPAFLAQSLHLGSSQPTNVLNRIASPAGGIALALLLLAWIERSWLLLAITGGYLLIVVTAAGQHSHHSGKLPLAFPPPVSQWAFLPHLLLGGGVLLLGALILALSQRPRRGSSG
jgi:hypothetical protein